MSNSVLQIRLCFLFLDKFMNQTSHAVTLADSCSLHAVCYVFLMFLVYSERWLRLQESFCAHLTLDKLFPVIKVTSTKANNLYLCQWHTFQKPAPENWRRFLAHLSYNLVPNFSGARFWSRIEHVLFRDRIWQPRDQNTDLWLVSVQCCCCFRSLEL